MQLPPDMQKNSLFVSNRGNLTTVCNGCPIFMAEQASSTPVGLGGFSEAFSYQCHEPSPPKGLSKNFLDPKFSNLGFCKLSWWRLKANKICRVCVYIYIYKTRHGSISPLLSVLPLPEIIMHPKILKTNKFLQYNAQLIMTNDLFLQYFKTDFDISKEHTWALGHTYMVIFIY